jgi:excisionase family DNA binding protein
MPKSTESKKETKPGPDLPYLLTVEETADFLRTTKHGIYCRIDRGQIPSVKLHGRLLVRRDDLLDLVNANLRALSIP